MMASPDPFSSFRENIMIKQILIPFLLFLLALLMGAPASLGEPQIPVAAPVDTELAGRTASTAIPSVYRIFFPKGNIGGTGFLHKSGVIITANHVVADCAPGDLIVLPVQGQKISITKIVSDARLDLALLTPSEKLSGPCLQISSDPKIAVGMQVSTWGFPEGYRGRPPLLTTGYISGIDYPNPNEKAELPRLVVNAAFNRGNSGGPLVEIERGTVVGVVCSKLAPLPSYVEQYLKVLRTTKVGVGYTKTNPDGSTEKIMEAQLLEEILQYLRSQTQLVIGYAVLGNHLRDFLRKNGIEP